MKSKKRNRRKKSKASRGLNISLRRETRQSLMIIVLVALALVILLALLDISGDLGRLIISGLRYTFGWGVFLLPLLLVLMAISIYRDTRDEEEEKNTTHAYIGVGVLTLVAIVFLQLLASREAETQFAVAQGGDGGGIIGAVIGYGILESMGPWAGFILLAAGAVAGLIITFNISLSMILGSFKREKPESSDREAIKTENAEAVRINGLEKEKIKQKESEEVLVKPPAPANMNLPKFMGGLKNTSGPTKNTPIDTTPKSAPPKVINKNWAYPSVDLLEQSNTNIDSGNIEANVAIIQKTLANFDIEVEMGEVNVGPTVTQYTLRPLEGVRLSNIVALQSDLKLALAAPSIRIEAPIPGKSLVGVEIPNKTTAIVRVKELFEMPEFQNHSSSLSFIIGRDVAGKGIVEDLSKMPHLLIAGSTGSGKSVCMNVLLTSFLMRNTPEDVKMIIVDPKRVEMTLYNDIPHLITPVITDHQKAINALKWAVGEMDRRYLLLAETHKRNIGEYNESTPEKLPYLVVVVDELADLMTVAKNDVEAAVVRLAQMARAVGIHLVLATQRPSVDIITGLIKANVTSRIAFAVASQVDSRTILDQSGAEKLLGKGDMLYITAEMSQPKRLQGALISGEEVKSITDFLKQEARPQYDDTVTEKKGSGDKSFNGDGDDYDEPLLDEARSIIIDAGKASASLLQRRLRVGYARAARMLDLLEEQGAVGPQEGSKPRDVYIQAEDDGHFSERENLERDS